MIRNKIFILSSLVIFIIANTFVLYDLYHSKITISKKLKIIEKENFLNLSKYKAELNDVRKSNLKYLNNDVFDKINKVYDDIKSDSTKIYDAALKSEILIAVSSSNEFKNIKIQDFNSNLLTLWLVCQEMMKIYRKNFDYPEHRLIIENLKKSPDRKISFSVTPILIDNSNENETGIKIFNEKNQLISTSSAFIYSGDYTKLFFRN